MYYYNENIITIDIIQKSNIGVRSETSLDLRAGSCP